MLSIFLVCAGSTTFSKYAITSSVWVSTLPSQLAFHCSNSSLEINFNSLSCVIIYLQLSHTAAHLFGKLQSPTVARPNPWYQGSVLLYGGGGEIRTHGPLRIDGFQDRWVKPLPHASSYQPTSALTNAVRTYYNNTLWFTTGIIPAPIVAATHTSVGAPQSDLRSVRACNRSVP